MKERKKFEVIKALSEIMEKFNIFRNILFTVVDIKLPKRGGYLKVYLSIFPEEKKSEFISYFQKIRSTIKNQLKKQVFLRHLPSKIAFYTSKEFEEAEKVFKILEKIKNEEKSK